MRRSRKSREMDERFARFEAENRAVVYLDKFSPQVAFYTALHVEWSLATTWEEEQWKMIQRGDPRKVFPITDKHWLWLINEANEMSPSVRSDAAAEQHVLDLLADFPPDQAWFVAHNVAWWAEYYARMEHIKVAS